MTKENKELLSKVVNNEEIDKVKFVSENFLKIIFEYDEKTNRSENTKPYVTSDFFNKNNLKPAETQLKYKSTYDKSETYITGLKNGKVFARVWNSFEINSVKTSTQTILILNLV